MVSPGLCIARKCPPSDAPSLINLIMYDTYSQNTTIDLMSSTIVIQLPQVQLHVSALCIGHEDGP